MTKNLFRIGSQLLAITTIVRQLRRAREDGDNLEVFDAVINGLAILTTVAILVREIRRRGGDGSDALEGAPL